SGIPSVPSHGLGQVKALHYHVARIVASAAREGIMAIRALSFLVFIMLLTGSASAAPSLQGATPSPVGPRATSVPLSGTAASTTYQTNTPTSNTGYGFGWEAGTQRNLVVNSFHV